MTLIIFGVFAFLIIIGCPVAFSMLLGGIIPIGFFTNLPLVVIAQRLFVSLDSFTLLAMPFFIFAGSLMQKGGVAKRLVDFAYACVGWMPGGLAIVTFFASALFGAISGSSSATVAAIGGMMIPAMVQSGYPIGFAAATAASAGFLGVIIPPSIPMILYGISVGDVSISDMFIGGVIPGILLASGMSVYAYIYGKKHIKAKAIFSWKEVGRTFLNARWAIGMPVIILGGIYSGIFTPTEAAAVAVVYGIVIGFFVYKELDVKIFLSILRSSIVTNSVLLLIVSTAAAFAFIMISEQIPVKISNFIIGIAQGKATFYVLVLLLLLVVGAVMDTAPAILVLGPLLSDILPKYGINSLSFGVTMVCLLAIGMVTPPVGLNLYVTANLIGGKMETVINRHLFIFLTCAVIVVIVMMFFPGIITFLPSLLAKKVS